ncbi:hypothetical protein [uncultured Campylobacter sp.]|nr:hypothetical protein [uncultured Campylobacter sp.]
MKIVAALVIVKPAITREIVERRDKIHSQALNFALLSMAISDLF